MRGGTDPVVSTSTNTDNTWTQPAPSRPYSKTAVCTHPAFPGFQQKPAYRVRNNVPNTIQLQVKGCCLLRAFRHFTLVSLIGISLTVPCFGDTVVWFGLATSMLYITIFINVVCHSRRLRLAGLSRHICRRGLPHNSYGRANNVTVIVLVASRDWNIPT